MTTISAIGANRGTFDINKMKNESIARAYGQFGAKTHLDLDTYAKTYDVDPLDAYALDLNDDQKISIWEKTSEMIAKKILKQNVKGPVASAVTSVIYESQGLKEQEDAFLEAMNMPVKQKAAVGNAIYFNA